jgi:hypothetical protein
MSESDVTALQRFLILASCRSSRCHLPAWGQTYAGQLCFIAVFVDELVDICVFGVLFLVGIDGEQKERAAVSCQ